MGICGPSEESKANAKAQTNFYNFLTGQQHEMFGAQTDLLNKIKAATEPILSAGPQQYGFSPEQERVMESAITERGAKATSDIVNATELAERQKTGGTNLIPTGGQTQMEENARILEGQSTAQQLANLKLQGYQRGGDLYSQALDVLSGRVGQLQNPNAYAGAATGAGGEATSATHLMDSERSNILQSVLGGVIGGGEAFLGGFGSSMGKK